MRIIAGSHRGREILAPDGRATTRPITDRVKESLFNRLHALGVLGYGHVLDLYCGTGSMGLEALSRGAERCTFVDLDRYAQRQLSENLERFGWTERARCLQASVTPGLFLDPLEDGSVPLALIDPPYRDAEDPAKSPGFAALLDRLYAKLEDGGVAMFRAPAEAAAPEPTAAYDRGDVTYGGMTLHFFQRPLEGT